MTNADRLRVRAIRSSTASTTIGFVVASSIASVVVGLSSTPVHAQATAARDCQPGAQESLAAPDVAVSTARTTASTTASTTATNTAAAQTIDRSAPSALEAELAAIRAERRNTSRLWPAVMLATGVTAVVAGAGAGLGYVHACGGSNCTVPAWVAISVVAGAAFASVGTVWLVSVNHSLSQLDMKASMLEQEVDRFRVRSAIDRRELALRTAPELLTLHVTF